jgi:hypothetical protein
MGNAVINVSPHDFSIRHIDIQIWETIGIYHIGITKKKKRKLIRAISDQSQPA